MSKFVCEQIIAHFQKLLSETTDAGLQRTLQALLSSAKREFAILNSTLSGAEMLPICRSSKTAGGCSSGQAAISIRTDNSPHPYMLLDPGPGLHIVDINDAYAEATFIERSDVVGRSLFEVFPDNPDDMLADGVSKLYTSLRTVAHTGQPHAMAIQRYDIRDRSNEFVERHWQPTNYADTRRGWASSLPVAPCRRRDAPSAGILIWQTRWKRSSQPDTTPADDRRA